VIVLGFDTATPSTAVGLRMSDGSTLQARDDPGPDEHPGHATRLLALVNDLLEKANMGWSEIDRIAAGLGPGTFTGLRVGLATARALAQSLGVELAGVSSLRALAEPALRSGLERSGVLAVLDARRGEAFAAAYEMTGGGGAEELIAPRALAPEELGSIIEQAEAQREDERGGQWLAVGDGAVSFRSQLQASGVAVPPDSSILHLVSAAAICDLGARATPVAGYETIVPDYQRRPDAELALERARAAGRAYAGRSAGE
jgi:tRNA threonylcarbamoyladenosine biosynthesis protein TsaB